MTTFSDSETPQEPSGATTHMLLPRRNARRMAVGGGLLVALLVVPLLLLSASHNRAAAEQARPTATPAPTATATPIPNVTVVAGYQPFVDRADGFIIQYPTAWACSASNPGVDCVDSPDTQNYRLQVQLPSDWTAAQSGSDPNNASVWVDYSLSAFAGVPGRTYERVPGPAPAATFGGTTWQTGSAIVGMEQTGSPTPGADTDQVRIRVQVYATVHNGRPYIIALYAADNQFRDGTTLYFQPMLKSFAFLPANS